MQTSVLDAKHFHDEQAAYAYLEARLWPNGPVCPHCGGFDRIGKLAGKSTRVGVYKCYQCRKPFRVTVGTVFESSHVPLRLWLQCVHLMASSKKGISSNQLHRTLGVTLKTAWFMSHRVREDQHCAEKHLHRYLAEFDFRYSNRVGLGVGDVARADRALKGIVGKRLTYRPPHH